MLHLNREMVSKLVLAPLNNTIIGNSVTPKCIKLEFKSLFHSPQVSKKKYHNNLFCSFDWLYIMCTTTYVQEDISFTMGNYRSSSCH